MIGPGITRLIISYMFTQYQTDSGLGSTSAQAYPPQRKLAPPPPHFKSFKYHSEGEKAVYRVKNIMRNGKTICEIIVTMFPSK